MADMTREEMERVIDGGGSVLVRVGNVKRLATHRDHLPKESEIASASGDPAQVAAVRQVLVSRRKALDAEIEALGDPGASGPEAPPAPKHDNSAGEPGPTPVTNPDLQGGPEKKAAPPSEPKKPEPKGK